MGQSHLAASYAIFWKRRQKALFGVLGCWLRRAMGRVIPDKSETGAHMRGE